MTIANPAYEIETERLLVRCYAPTDAPTLGTLLDGSREHLLRSAMHFVKEPNDVDSVLARVRRFRAGFDQGTDLVYGIFARSGELLGGTGLHPRIGPDAIEIGYWLGGQHEGHGYVGEAAAALARVAIELHGIRRVEIRCIASNARSANVARRLGCTLDGTLRARLVGADGTLADAMIWSLFDHELDASPAKRVAYEARDSIGRVILPAASSGS